MSASLSGEVGIFLIFNFGTTFYLLVVTGRTLNSKTIIMELKGNL
jgi:hypothetical protein